MPITSLSAWPIYKLHQLKNPYENTLIFDVMWTVLEIHMQGVQGTHREMFGDQIDHILAKPQLMALAVTMVLLLFLIPQ